MNYFLQDQNKDDEYNPVIPNDYETVKAMSKILINCIINIF